MKPNNNSLIFFALACEKKANSVNTTMIEIIYTDQNISSQFWYHYESVTVRKVDEDYLLFEFFNNNHKTAAFITTFNAIKAERLLHIEALGKYKDHYHILISDSLNSSNSNDLSEEE